jgi:hypothetical protein
MQTKAAAQHEANLSPELRAERDRSRSEAKQHDDERIAAYKVR